MRYICWVLFLCLFLCGYPQEPVETATHPVSGQPSELVAEQVAFVAYVEDTNDGGTQAVVYYPDQDRSEVVATGGADESPLVLKILPRRWRLWAPFGGARLIYLDSITGKLVEPSPNLSLEENRQWALIDLVGDRAVVLEHEGGHGQRLTARLYLVRGSETIDLGRVFVQSPLSSIARTYHSLSADRNYLTWDGPDGRHRCDLRTGDVHAQEHPRKELPDGTGSIEQWQDGAGIWHWKLFDADGEQPVASGEGRIREISPGCTYWAIINDAEDYDPPRFVQIIPGREPSAETRIAEGPWAINGTEAQFWATRPSRDSEVSSLYRITPEGYKLFTYEGYKGGLGRVLTVENGGRVALRLRTPKTTSPGVAEGNQYTHELVIIDFTGNEKLRTEIGGSTMGVPPPVADYVCVVGKILNDWQVKRINFITGEVKLVLNCSAVALNLGRVGTHYLARAYQGEGREAPYDLYVSKQNAERWDLLAGNAREVQWRPVN